MSNTIKKLSSYQALAKHFDDIKSLTLRELFAQDANRFSKFSVQFEGLLFDYSKNRITKDTLAKLIALFNECDVDAWREKMFAGEKINTTENRGVQHIALRDLENKNSEIANKQIDALKKIESFIAKLKKSNITDVVNIGIGGSHLGPQFVCDALREYSCSNLNVHFVANVDAEEINRALENLNPKSTLFIVTSKSFTTQETLTNSITARTWLTSDKNLKNEDHFVAVTANVKKATEFGIAQENIFPMWDEIGGRYSLWSAVGLSIAVKIGMEDFKELLKGAHAMDQHFFDTPADQNILVLLYQ